MSSCFLKAGDAGTSSGISASRPGLKTQGFRTTCVFGDQLSVISH
ncbi:hypothetical protein [Chroococcidiopsis sp.]